MSTSTTLKIRRVLADVPLLAEADTVDASGWQLASDCPVVVIDEFHHAMAPACRRMLDHLQPQQLLGLTATPERGDGVDVAQQFFDGRTASELRLWDALDADLLVPFHYFGVSGTTSTSASWSGSAAFTTPRS